MLTTEGHNCSVCGSNKINNHIIEKGIFLINDKVFEIRNIPGYICTECEEEQMNRQTYSIFKKILLEGNYNQLEETEIPYYLYPQDNLKIEIGILKECDTCNIEDNCVFCGGRLYSGYAKFPIGTNKDNFYLIEKIPSYMCKDCDDSILYNRETREKMNEFKNRIKNKEVQIYGKRKYIVLKVQ